MEPSRSAPARGRPRGLFLPGKATTRQRLGYALGAVISGTLAGLFIVAGATSQTPPVLEGALGGGLGAATILFLLGAVLNRPIKWR